MNSDAVLHMWSRAWLAMARGAAIFKIIPRFIRDPIYKLIARNRYKWFGKRATCWMPTPEQASRIL